MHVLVPSRLSAPTHPCAPLGGEGGRRDRAGVGAQEPLGNPAPLGKEGSARSGAPADPLPLPVLPGTMNRLERSPGEVYKGAETRACGASAGKQTPPPRPSLPQAPPAGVGVAVPEAVPSSALPVPLCCPRGASEPRVIGRGVAGKGLRAGVWAGGGGEWRGLLTARFVPPCGCDRTQGCAAVQ